jgi:hypothetical protein
MHEAPGMKENTLLPSTVVWNLFMYSQKDPVNQTNLFRRLLRRNGLWPCGWATSSTPTSSSGPPWGSSQAAKVNLQLGCDVIGRATERCSIILLNLNLLQLSQNPGSTDKHLEKSVLWLLGL